MARTIKQTQKELNEQGLRIIITFEQNDYNDLDLEYRIINKEQGIDFKIWDFLYRFREENVDITKPYEFDIIETMNKIGFENIISLLEQKLGEWESDDYDFEFQESDIEYGFETYYGFEIYNAKKILNLLGR